MTSTEKRGLTAPEAVLAYCTSWTQAAYLICWPDKGAGDATAEMMEETRLAVAREMMAMLRHELPEQDDTAPASEPMGEDNESYLKSAAWQGFDPKFPDPAQFNEPAPVPLWVEGRPGKDMPRREVTQDELRHLRLYPERDELSGGGLRFVGLLFFNAAEWLTRKRSETDCTHSGMAGRPTPKHLYIQEMKRRATNGLLRDTLAQEARDLLDWMGQERPDLNSSKTGTIENAIRDTFRTLAAESE